MNELNPIVPPAAITPAPDYKDRSGGLVVFGVLTILLGVVSGMMVPFMLLGQLMNARNPGGPGASLTMLLPVLLMYAGMAAILIWLGIGSIKARRWARALLLIFAWSWLIIGVITMAAMMVVFPKLLANINSNVPAGQQGVPPAALGVILVITGLILGFIFILIPAVWIFFYGSRHVKATCEARDPVRRWTDVCPLPVLAMSLWLWFAVPMLALMPVAYHAVAPFFGSFLTGAPGALFYLAMAAVWGWAGWRIYRLDVRAWWVLLAVLLLFSASSLLTYTHHDLVEMYRLMGYPEAQLEQMQKSGLLTGNYMAWLTGCSMVPFLGYLLFVKRYLRKAFKGEK
ncbi:MAG: hypothetical protein ABSE16_04080 [Verrucomicrobiota bacterium]|jgi:hypothetical protein